MSDWTAIAMVNEAKKQARRKLRPRFSFPIKREVDGTVETHPWMRGTCLRLGRLWLNTYE